ncbi:MAG: hypothetical protein CME64_16125 [Halobacteriovoraceae bacterium]|nr:hypothetical protein [Halobacteriovoraceae bacterium]|tara:strand:- start:36739 stop:36936 length:198 start_codon:yes stop_codon:yes gene_type:complete
MITFVFLNILAFIDMKLALFFLKLDIKANLKRNRFQTLAPYPNPDQYFFSQVCGHMRKWFIFYEK